MISWAPDHVNGNRPTGEEFLLRLAFLAIVLLLACHARAEQPACAQEFRYVRSETLSLPQQEEFLRAVIARSGCRLEVLRFEYPPTQRRRLEMLRLGELDIIIGASRLPEREVYGLYSIPFRQATVRLWSRREDAERYRTATLASLVAAGARILGPSAGWLGPDYEALRTGNYPGLVQFKLFVQGVDLLLAGHADVLLHEEVWMNSLDPARRDALFMLPTKVFTEPLYFLFSRRTVTPATVDRVNEAIRGMLAENPL